jgi:hypothetical protein
MQKFTGKEYLFIDIANSFGLDKLTWDERLKWACENEYQFHNLVSKAKDPAMFYAGTQAWHKTRCGEATGYPISLDATSSGLQILAALTGDRRAASICNVIDTGKREDAYTVVYDEMVKRIMLRLGLQAGNIDREKTKQAVMTSLYGSVAVPKEVFGEGVQLKIFYEVMNELAPAAWELNEAFLAFWNPTALSHDWVLPDNFHVHVKVMRSEKEVVHFMNEPYDTFYSVNAPTEEGRSLGANTIHSIDGMIVREMARRCNYNPDDVLRVIAGFNTEDGTRGMGIGRKCDQMVQILWDHYLSSGYLSARILEHLDAGNSGLVNEQVIWELIDSLPEKPFQMIAVHDCFRVLPNYANDLRTQYNLQLSLIAKSNLLQALLRQITGHKLNIGKLDPNLWKDIPNTNYALS